MIYKVTYEHEILAREEVVEIIEADSEEEAEELVRSGYGTTIDCIILESLGDSSGEYDVTNVEEYDN